MAARESIVQVVHHVHAFTPLHAQPMSVQAIAITTTREVSVQRVSELPSRTVLLSVLRVAIAHAATTMLKAVTASVNREAMVSVNREVTVSVNSREATVSVLRVAMVSVHSRVEMVDPSRVATVAHSREATAVNSREATVSVNSREAMVSVHSRVATVVPSRKAMASLTEQHLTRRVRVSALPITIQMQSTQ